MNLKTEILLVGQFLSSAPMKSSHGRRQSFLPSQTSERGIQDLSGQRKPQVVVYGGYGFVLILGRGVVLPGR